MCTACDTPLYAPPAMDIITVERDIAAPPDRVWAMVSDVTRMGEWSPEATGAQWRGGATGPHVGAKFKGLNRSGKRRWTTACTITECEPGLAFAFNVASGPLSVATWTYRLTATPTGCHVTESWTDTRGGIIRTLGKLVTGVADRATHNRDGMEQTLAALATAAAATAE